MDCTFPEFPATAGLSDRLRADVTHLAGTIGKRNFDRPDALQAAADWLAERLGPTVERLPYQAEGRPFENLTVELPGLSRKDEIVVFGAHYDSVITTPGANDNGSGVAVLLALYEAAKQAQFERTVRFVAFTNEEPPFFLSSDMGSVRYAQACKARGDKVVGMVSLETMGYYSDRPGSQRFPDPALAEIFPSTGNFLALVADERSRALVETLAKGFRDATDFPVEAAAFPTELSGVSWSDHWSFWQVGYPAVMATDTAPFRYPHYHEPEDTPDKVNYEALAEVTRGMWGALGAIAGLISS